MTKTEKFENAAPPVLVRKLRGSVGVWTVKNKHVCRDDAVTYIHFLIGSNQLRLMNAKRQTSSQSWMVQKKSLVLLSNIVVSRLWYFSKLPTAESTICFLLTPVHTCSA